MGGHYDRRHKVQDSDIWVECCCSECRDDPTPGLLGKRILCRKYEAHGGDINDKLDGNLRPALLQLARLLNHVMLGSNLRLVL